MDQREGAKRTGKSSKMPPIDSLGYADMLICESAFRAAVTLKKAGI